MVRSLVSITQLDEAKAISGRGVTAVKSIEPGIDACSTYSLEVEVRFRPWVWRVGRFLLTSMSNLAISLST